MKRFQQGQALSEFLVAASFILVPLWLAIAALGKFIDVRHASAMAARYVAWERTVWYEDRSSAFQRYQVSNLKSGEEIRKELANRILNHRGSDALITNADKRTAILKKGIDPLWQDAHGTPYLDRLDQLAVQTGTRAPAHNAAGAALALVGQVGVPQVTGSLVPPVPSDTLAVSVVTLTGVARQCGSCQWLQPGDPAGGAGWQGMDVAASSAILSNTWYANSSQGTQNMVRQSVPAANGLGTAVQRLVQGALLGWDPMNAARLDLGRLGVDVVPQDRLK